MINDHILRLVLIPVLGLYLAIAAGVMNFNLTRLEIVISLVYYLAVFFFVWIGTVKIISVLRYEYRLLHSFYLKLVTVSIACCVFATVCYFLTFLLWKFFFLKSIAVYWNINLIDRVIVVQILIALLYEVLFLQAEKDLDDKALELLDKERIQAEINILNNELDPHFIFNCLTSLLQLVHTDQDKSYKFIQKLAKVYKYFLINKEKEFVTVTDEIDFLNNYYYLLKERYDNSIKIEYKTIEVPPNNKLLPCTLQLLVENAIKHNFFSTSEPLCVFITINKNHLIVSNPIRPKLYEADSTQVGLRNLKNRYKLIMNKEIVVQTVQNKFFVKLPLLKSI